VNSIDETHPSHSVWVAFDFGHGYFGDFHNVLGDHSSTDITYRTSQARCACGGSLDG
jgi:hypothetical protein